MFSQKIIALVVRYVNGQTTKLTNTDVTCVIEIFWLLSCKLSGMLKIFSFRPLKKQQKVTLNLDPKEILGRTLEAGYCSRNGKRKKKVKKREKKGKENIISNTVFRCDEPYTRAACHLLVYYVRNSIRLFIFSTHVGLGVNNSSVKPRYYEPCG